MKKPAASTMSVSIASKERAKLDESPRRLREAARTQSRAELRRLEERLARVRREGAQHYEPTAVEVRQIDQAKRQMELDARASTNADERAARILPLVRNLRDAIAKWASEQAAKTPPKENWIHSWLPKLVKQKPEPDWLESGSERLARETAVAEQAEINRALNGGQR
jgi:hypothetical protein